MSQFLSLPLISVLPQNFFSPKNWFIQTERDWKGVWFLGPWYKRSYSILYETFSLVEQTERIHSLPVVRGPCPGLAQSEWNHYLYSVWILTSFFPRKKNLYVYKKPSFKWHLELWICIKWEMNKFTYELTKSRCIMFPDSRLSFCL